MMAFNYPNHPLFRITPLLNDGQNRVMHDEYTSHLIGRIRAGRYTPDLWDCNSLYLGTPWRVPQFAVPSRYKMTADEIAAYKDDPAWKAERARLAEEQRARRAEKKAQREAEETKLAAHRRAMAEERERYEQEYQAAKARRQAEQEQRDREWLMVGAETQQYLTEQAMVMAGSWECTGCQTPARIERAPSGRYTLSCRRCARHIVADHVTMLNVVNAQKAQPEPTNPG